MVSIGRILRSQGREGELRLKLYLGPSFIPFFFRVYLQKKGVLRDYKVEFVRPYKDSFIVKFREIESLSEAREIVGEEVFLPEKELQALEKGSYYLYQLIGCSVTTKNGDRIGVVENILSISESELLVVRSREEDILIPFVSEICIQMNIDKKEIIIDPPEGLLDLNEI